MNYQSELLPLEDAPIEQLVDELDSLIKAELVTKGNLDFASSLVKQYKQRGTLSEKQTPWVAKIIERTLKGEPEVEKVALGGSFEAISSLFDVANGKLKYPKIWLQTPDGQPIQLSRAGPNAKFPGSINVTDGGKYGDNKWYGRILVGGIFEKAKYEHYELEDMLVEFAKDPAGFAASQGHLTGHCCFCNTPLTAEKSTVVGYGPVCAKNFGLPYGKKQCS